MVDRLATYVCVGPSKNKERLTLLSHYLCGCIHSQPSVSIHPTAREIFGEVHLNILGILFVIHCKTQC